MSDAMSGLTDFLLARIADDEAATLILDCNCGEGVAEVDPLPGCPDRVLVECEARRRIVKRAQTLHRTPMLSYEGAERAYEYDDNVLPLLALPYADHPDYRAEWRP